MRKRERLVNGVSSMRPATAGEINVAKRTSRGFLFCMGLLFIGAMAFPLPAANPVAVASASLRRGRRSAGRPGRASPCSYFHRHLARPAWRRLADRCEITGIGLLPLFAAVTQRDPVVRAERAGLRPDHRGQMRAGRSSRLSGMLSGQR